MKNYLGNVPRANANVVMSEGMLMNCTMGIGRSLQSSINPWRIISNNQLINEPKPIISVYTEI